MLAFEPQSQPRSMLYPIVISERHPPISSPIVHRPIQPIASPWRCVRGRMLTSGPAWNTAVWR